jgi:hypothetical protein
MSFDAATPKRPAAVKCKAKNRHGAPCGAIANTAASAARTAAATTWPRSELEAAGRLERPRSCPTSSVGDDERIALGASKAYATLSPAKPPTSGDGYFADDYGRIPEPPRSAFRVR